MSSKTPSFLSWISLYILNINTKANDNIVYFILYSIVYSIVHLHRASHKFTKRTRTADLGVGIGQGK